MGGGRGGGLGGRGGFGGGRGGPGGQGGDEAGGGGRGLTLSVSAQNLFNQEYIVGTLPTTIGSPRLVNFGARVRFSGR